MNWQHPNNQNNPSQNASSRYEAGKHGFSWSPGAADCCEVSVQDKLCQTRERIENQVSDGTWSTFLTGYLPMHIVTGLIGDS